MCVCVYSAHFFERECVCMCVCVCEEGMFVSYK